MIELQHCNACGEGFTNFCRGKSEACRMRPKDIVGWQMNRYINGDGDDDWSLWQNISEDDYNRIRAREGSNPALRLRGLVPE